MVRDGRHDGHDGPHEQSAEVWRLIDADAATSTTAPPPVRSSCLRPPLASASSWALPLTHDRALASTLATWVNQPFLNVFQMARGRRSPSGGRTVTLDDDTRVLCPRGGDGDGADTTVDGHAKHTLQILVRSRDTTVYLAFEAPQSTPAGSSLPRILRQ